MGSPTSGAGRSFFCIFYQAPRPHSKTASGPVFGLRGTSGRKIGFVIAELAVGPSFRDDSRGERTCPSGWSENRHTPTCMTRADQTFREQNRKAKAERRARRRASGFRTITIEVKDETAERLASIKDGLALRHLGQAFDKVIAECSISSVTEGDEAMT